MNINVFLANEGRVFCKSTFPIFCEIYVRTFLAPTYLNPLSVSVALI